MISAASTSPDPTSLDRLHDIIVPAPISWWPPAPGWFVLGAVVILILLLGAMWFVRRYRMNLYRRQAMNELHQIAMALRAPDSRAEAMASIACLLKRVALTIYPRNQVAPMTGGVWIAFLQRTCKQKPLGKSGKLLAAAPYDPHPARQASPEDIDELISTAEFWIAHHQAPAHWGD
jgi:hypothetical protein